MFQYTVPIESVLFQSPLGGLSRLYLPANSQPTVLTAVPTHCAHIENIAEKPFRSPKGWDGNPETFSHPLLRKYTEPIDDSESLACV
jgi:hypothetical protein